VDTFSTMPFLLFSEETLELYQLHMPLIMCLGFGNGVCIQITKQPLQNILFWDIPDLS